MPINLQDGVEVEITEEQLQEMTSSTENNVAQYLRMERNALLAETDWWAVADRTMTQAETDYRQALRDVPAQAGFPDNVTWPTKP
jgi:hypothetical protein